MHHAACECPDCDWGQDDCDEICTCPDVEDGSTTEPCKRCDNLTEGAVMRFNARKPGDHVICEVRQIQ